MCRIRSCAYLVVRELLRQLCYPVSLIVILFTAHEIGYWEYKAHLHWLCVKLLA